MEGRQSTPAESVLHQAFALTEGAKARVCRAEGRRCAFTESKKFDAYHVVALKYANMESRNRSANRVVHHIVYMENGGLGVRNVALCAPINGLVRYAENATPMLARTYRIAVTVPLFSTSNAE